MAEMRYRVSFESKWPNDWRRIEKEHDSLVEAIDQYLTLKGWSETGEEPIRNVKLEEGVIEWKDLKWVVEATKRGKANATDDSR